MITIIAVFFQQYMYAQSLETIRQATQKKNRNL